MRVLKSKYRRQLSVQQRRRTLRKTENKIIKRRQMLFLISLGEQQSQLI